MTKLKVIGSGSSGNAYIIDADGDKLIIEAGVKWKEILKSLHYDLDISGVLISHIHKDHSKLIPVMLSYGLRVFSCKTVADKYKGVKWLRPNKKYKIGKFMVQPIPVKHSVENYGYLIEHPKMGRLVFATDLYEFLYKIPHVDHWMLEANYDDEIILDRMCDNQENWSKSDTHLSINQCVETLKNNLCRDTKTIMLIHLSNGNSDEKKFAKMVKNATDITPYIADTGLEIELNKDYF